MNEQDALKDVYFRALTGSKAYGLAHEGSDDDWRGWYAPPSEIFFGLITPAEQLTFAKSEDST